MRVLLDCGSQRSYITERAQQLLNLDPEGEQRLAIAAFGSAREDSKVCLSSANQCNFSDDASGMALISLCQLTLAFSLACNVGQRYVATERVTLMFSNHSQMQKDLGRGQHRDVGKW